VRLAFREPAAGLLIALAFLFVSLMILNDYGQTWDEQETYAAAFRNVDIVAAVAAGQPAPPWTFHELPGYYFVFDLLRGGFAWIASKRLHLLDEVRAFHLTHVLISTLSVFLFYLVARRVSGRERIAVLSTVVLVLMPQFLAQAQNNPKDLPGLFVYVLAIYTFTRQDATSRFHDVLLAGLALGLALTTTVAAVLLIPLLATWQLLVRHFLKWQSYVTIVVVAAVAAFLFWPWLWQSPIANAAWALSHIATFKGTPLKVLYLGRLYDSLAVPWHYSLVNFITTTPVPYLLLAAASVPSVLSRIGRGKANPANIARLGWLWFAVPLVSEIGAPAKYNAVRHLLMIVPGFCLCVGVGLNWILERLERTQFVSRSPRLGMLIAPGCAVVLFGFIGLELIEMHPYHNAYRNEAVNAWIPHDTQNIFEVEYWGQTYKEGAEWLNAHTGPDAQIYAGMPEPCANRYLDGKANTLTEKALSLFEDPTRPAYLMVMARKAIYTPAIERIVGNYDPVFTIRRQKAVLLNIYSNRPRVARTQ
jgi:hypothetical protein